MSELQHFPGYKLDTANMALYQKFEIANGLHLIAVTPDADGWDISLALALSTTTMIEFRPSSIFCLTALSVVNGPAFVSYLNIARWRDSAIMQGHEKGKKEGCADPNDL